MSERKKTPLPVIGFLGAGAMGQAIASGFLRGVASNSNTNSSVAIEKIVLLTRSSASGEAAKKALLEGLKKAPASKQPAPKIELAAGLKTFCLTADRIFLCFKPQNFSAVRTAFIKAFAAASLSEERALRQKIYVSVLVGVRMEKITQLLAGVGAANRRGAAAPAEGWKVGRAMPNTPTLIGKGAGGVAFNKNLSLAERKEIMGYFVRLGDYHPVAEQQLDAISAVSGSGPAFVFLFIEALSEAGVRLGLPRQLALKLAAATVSGAGQLLEKKAAERPPDFHPALLKEQVTSPGGTTAEGLYALEKRRWRAAVLEAVSAAAAKAGAIADLP